MARKLEVEIVGDASSLKRALGDAETHSSKFGNALGGIAKAGVLAAGAAGVGGLLVTLKAGIDDFKESARVSAQTEAVIKSTGGSARITANQVSNLAGAISNYSGVDDEAVQAGENMLLTFTNVKNEVGKGNDIFNQSTRILTDMSVAMGTDMSKQAIQLGKALNDPIHGVSALAKVGVTFTEGQKATIKSLVDMGDTAGAQKIILAELNKEFGGSAKAAGDTLPGQIDKLKNAFGNMSGALVGAAVPALTSFLGLVTEKGLPALQNLFDAVQEKIGPALSVLGDAIRSAGPPILAVFEAIGDAVAKNVLPVLEKLGEIGGEAIKKIGDVLRDNGPQIHQIFDNLGAVIRDVASVAVPLIKVAFDTVLPIALRIVIPILETLTTTIRAVFDAIKYVADNIGGPLTSAKNLIVAFKDDVGTLIGDVVGFFKDLPGRARDAFLGAWGSVRGAFTGALDDIKGWAQTPIRAVVGFFEDMPQGIADAIVRGAKAAGDAIKHAILKVFSVLPGFVRDALGISSPSTVFAEIGRNIIAGAVQGIKDKASSLLDAARDAFGKIGASVSPGVAMGGLVPQVMRALVWARQHGWGGTVISGWRSYQEQAALYARYVNSGFDPRYIAAPPGRSSHEFGQAVDVTDYDAFARAMSSAPLDSRLYNRLGGRDKPHFSVSGYAEGGVFTAPTLGVIGEKGPEAVIPLDRYPGVGTVVVNVNVHGSVQTERDLARTIRDELVRAGIQNGGAMFVGQA